MYCSSCGTENTSEGNFCSSCGNEFRYTTETEEKTIMESLCRRLEGRFNPSGKLILTNKKFIFYKHSILKISILGPLSILTKKNADIVIPINSISRLEEVSKGKAILRNNNFLTITQKDGQSYEFSTDKYMDWENTFKKILSDI